MPTDVPFHALGKPSHRDPGYHEAKAAFAAWCQQRGVWPRLTREEIWDAGYEDGRTHEAKQRESQPVTWVQPVGIDALLLRLADARDLAVPERERENLCSVAHGTITKLVEVLQGLVDDSYSLVEQPSWIRPSTGLGVYRCHQCEATKGETSHGHADDCAVGRAEAILRR